MSVTGISSLLLWGGGLGLAGAVGSWSISYETEAHLPGLLQTRNVELQCGFLPS